MFEIRANKKQIEKRCAKTVWTIMQIITVASIVFLLASISVMIEALKGNKTLFIISFICLVWIALFSSFINHANKEKENF